MSDFRSRPGAPGRARTAQGSALTGAALLGAAVAGTRLLVRRRATARRKRADDRVRRTWAALDLALRARAQAAVTAAAAPGTDPATALLVADAAVWALEPDLDRPDREQAESDLTRVVELTGLGTAGPLAHRVVLGRRLHNDAVVQAGRLGGRVGRRIGGRRVRPGRAGPAAASFEMAEPALGLRS